MKRRVSDKQIYQLRVDGKTYAEISQITGFGMNTINRSLKRTGLVSTPEKLLPAFPEKDSFCLLPHHRARLEEVRADIILRYYAEQR